MNASIRTRSTVFPAYLAVVTRSVLERAFYDCGSKSSRSCLCLDKQQVT